MKNLKIEELIRKKLPKTIFVIYAIKNEVNVLKGEIVETNNIYTLIGIDTKGIRHLLNIYQDKENNNHYWLDCFEGLKVRGLRNVLFLSVGENKNMKRTAKIAFPGIVFMDSITEIYPKFYKFTNERSANSIASKIKELYVQKTEKEYKVKLEEFKAKYNNVIHQKLIEKYLNNVENTYKYSQNIRKLIFKHSANSEYYDRIRIIYNNKKYIEGLNDIYEELNKQVDKYFEFTSFKKKEWTLILNDLIQIYPELELI